MIFFALVSHPLRRRGIFCLCLALAAALTGCRVREDDSVVRLRYALWGTVSQQKVEEAIVHEFEREHPEIRIELMVFGYLRYDEKINAMMVGDIAPDVMLINTVQYDNWWSRGALADLTPESEELGRDLTMYPGARAAFVREGRLYGLPINAHGMVTFVNLDAFAAAGVPVPQAGFTWDQIAEFGPKLSRQAGAKNVSTDFAVIPPFYSYSVLEEYGGAFFDDPYHPTRSIVASSAGEAWINWVRRLESSAFAVNRGVATDAGTTPLFRDGRAAMYFTGRWQTPDFEKVKFNWDVRPFPSGPLGRIAYRGGTAIGVSPKSRHPQEARLFARFYAGRVGSAIAMRGGRTVPVYREIAESPEFLSLHPPASVKHFADTMEEGASTTWIYAAGSQEVWDIANRRIEQALADHSLTAAEVTRLLAADLDRWLEHQRRLKKIPKT